MELRKLFLVCLKVFRRVPVELLLLNLLPVVTWEGLCSSDRVELFLSGITVTAVVGDSLKSVFEVVVRMSLDSLILEWSIYLTLILPFIKMNSSVTVP